MRSLSQVVANPNPVVAVIDIGSNSIKSLVVQKSESGSITSLHSKTLEARISAGISGSAPVLSEGGILRGVAAVGELLKDAASYSPSRFALVATSAVRDAANAAEFAERLLKQTGHAVRILSGDAEANLIGLGLTCDPALSGLQDFYVFDLGGGSLECLAFRSRRIEQALSLALGCVRLTEQCVANSKAPFTAESEVRVSELTKRVFSHCGFHFNLPPSADAVGTGGTLTTARAIIAARSGKKLEESDAIMTLEQLRELLAFVGWFDLEERRRVPALPPSRADVFPAALATLIAVAEVGGLHAFRHSLYNLRWGVAAESLG